MPDSKLEDCPIGALMPFPDDKVIPKEWCALDGQTLTAIKYPQVVALFHKNWKKVDHLSQIVKDFWARHGGEVAHDGEYIILPRVDHKHVPEIVWNNRIDKLPPMILIIKVY